MLTTIPEVAETAIPLADALGKRKPNRSRSVAAG